MQLLEQFYHYIVLKYKVEVKDVLMYVGKGTTILPYRLLRYVQHLALI